MRVLCMLQVSSIQQERAGTEGLVAQLGVQSAALEAWLAEHEWKADAAAAALAAADGKSMLDVNKVGPAMHVACTLRQRFVTGVAST